MYLDNKIHEDCCGCTACISICPKNAIEMKSDSHGFFYPTIDESICIQCNLCRQVCDFANDKESENSVVRALGVHHKSLDVRRKSRSGGAFYMLAEQMLEQGGIVWGAAFDEELNVVHKAVFDKSRLPDLQGSKYVQSDLKDCFTVIEGQLKTGRHVLFSGTACQVAGLRNFIQKKHGDESLLLTCDVVCQGVPSPLVYTDYLSYIEKKYGDKIKAFNFRDKARIGWSGHEESISFDKWGGKIYSRRYACIFYGHLSMRPSCFSCKYTCLHRPADFTLADFWKINEKYPEFADSKGNSVVLVNSEKATLFFATAKNRADIIDVAIDNCIQPRLESPNRKPSGYDKFWKEYETYGAKYCIEKHGRESFKSKLVYIIKPLLRKFDRLRG